MEQLKFRCPNPQCRIMLSIPWSMQGQRVRCAGCGQQFFAPPAGMRSSRIASPNRRRSAA